MLNTCVLPKPSIHKYCKYPQAIHNYYEPSQTKPVATLYESTVHLNATLSDVQKFTYLRSLIHGSASSAIAGFPLTNANYSNAIDLLKQRFRQPHKINANYMPSLIDIQRPDSSVVSLRTFHDKIETCIGTLALYRALLYSQFTYLMINWGMCPHTPSIIFM